MKSFNEELIAKTNNFHSLHHTDESEEIIEEKYSFLLYIFSNIESRSPDDLNICTEEFPNLGCNIDGYYKDEDSGTYELYLSVFDDKANDQSFMSKEQADSVYSGAVNFLKLVFSHKYFELDGNSLMYDIAQDLGQSMNDDGPDVVVNLVTNLIIPPAYKKDSLEKIEKTNVAFRTYDLPDLHEKFQALEQDSYSLDCINVFGKTIPALRITESPNFDVFLFAMRGDWLARLYKIDSVRLLEPNVRSYLKKTAKVNAGIFETIRNEPQEFVSYNNGISAVCTGVSFSANQDNGSFNIASLENFQIVNGGQTTATLSESAQEEFAPNLESVIVPVKLTVIKNLSKSSDLITNISTFSNTQTSIKKSDPPSNLPFYKEFKEMSRKCLSARPDGTTYVCYFERTNGEYDTELRRNHSSAAFKAANPKEYKFNKIELALAVDSWQQQPHVVCLGKEKNFDFFNKMIVDENVHPNDEYFKNAFGAVLLFKAINAIVSELNLSYKSNVVTYAMSLLSLKTDKKFPLSQYWETKALDKETETFLRNIVQKVSDFIFHAPSDCPEPRMWARKEKCWELIKTISSIYSINKKGEAVDFFPDNPALSFISNDDHFYDSTVWMTLLLWDSKYKVLNRKQIALVKFMRSMADKKENKLSQSKTEEVKSIFLYAVGKGFAYQTKGA